MLAPPNDAAADAQRDAASAFPDDSSAPLDAPTESVLCDGLDLSLVLCFDFDGVVKDGSPNQMATAALTDVLFVPGKYGKAASFAGKSAMTFNASRKFEVIAATIEAWVKPEPNPQRKGVIFDNDLRVSMTILATGALACAPNDGSGRFVTADIWTHVACVFDGKNVFTYVNGSKVGAGTGTIGTGSDAGAAVGGNAPSDEVFLGAIDSFRFFNVARTPAQVAAAAR